MTISGRLKALIPDLATTVARFPGPVIASVVSCIAANLTVAKKTFAIDQVYTDVLWSAAAAFLASGAVHLFAESRNWPRKRGAVYALLIGLATGAIYWFHDVLGVERQFFAVGLLILVMAAAYLRPQTSQAACWLFNLQLGLATLLAILVTVVSCGGITAILASLEFLFDIKIPHDLYGHIWSTGITLIGPIYGLALTPTSLNEEFDLESYRDSMLERGISALLYYIIVPITLVYAAILYAYAVKIYVAWTLPKGQVGILVTLFALAGTAAYLISYPWRSRGAGLLRAFGLAWFPLTIVPVVLLVIGTSRRIHDYGITPERYALIIIAAWLSGLIVTFAYNRRPIDIRYIVGSFAILALLTSIGPWGARQLSMNDQYDRLESLLTRYGFLINGRLADPVPPPTTMTDAQREMAGSIIYFLVGQGEHERFRSWFAGRDTSPWKRKDFRPDFVAQPLIRIVGYRYRDTPSNIQQVSFDSSLPSTFLAAEGKLIAGPIKLREDNRPQLEQSSSLPRMENQGTVLAILQGNRKWLVKTSDLLAQATDADSLPYPHPPFSITLDGPEGSVTLIVEKVFGQFDRGTAKINSGQFWFILPQ